MREKNLPMQQAQIRHAELDQLAKRLKQVPLLETAQEVSLLLAAALARAF
jgi:hypothetical protein